MPVAVLATGPLTSVITAPAQGLPAPAEAAAVDTDGWYVLVDRTSGKALDVVGVPTADGAALQQWADRNGAGRQFRPAGPDAAMSG